MNFSLKINLPLDITLSFNTNSYYRSIYRVQNRNPSKHNIRQFSKANWCSLRKF